MPFIVLVDDDIDKVQEEHFDEWIRHIRWRQSTEPAFRAITIDTVYCLTFSHQVVVGAVGTQDDDHFELTWRCDHSEVAGYKVEQFLCHLCNLPK